MNATPVNAPLGRLLRMAIVGGVENSVRVHVERGDNLNARDGNGMTPLMLSAARNCAGICRLLLDGGADGSLLSPLGETALEIAVAAGAHEAAGILALANASAQDCASPVTVVVTPPAIAVTPVPTLSTMFVSRSTDESELSAVLLTGPARSEHASVSNDPPEYNLDGWEPEEDSPPPESDQSVFAIVSAIHKTITEYNTFDASSDWEDVDINLPHEAVPLLRVRDATLNQRWRRLLLHAMRHGSISSIQVAALSLNPDGSLNPEMAAALSMAVHGVGAEVVDQALYLDVIGQLDELSEPESTLDEDAAIDEAIFFIEDNASGRTAPLRFYQKELQRQKLLISQQEISLVREMEKSSHAAIDALAAWPRGIALVIAAGRAVAAGQRRSNSYTRGSLEDEAHVPLTSESAEVLELPVAQEEEKDEETDQSNVSENSNPDECDDRFTQLSHSLIQLEFHLTDTKSDEKSVRETLLSLRLNHQFLFEIADAALSEVSECAMRYTAAIRDFRCSWEQMVLANIKLAFSLAHKYRYSGDPLDDLAQEGNLGLLKAVERFDWRLGYKFSTYATWWVKQSLGRHVADKCRTIRVPVHVHANLKRMLWETRALESESYDTPKLHVIATRMNMRPEKVAALQRLEHEGIPLDEASFAELMDSGSASAFCLPDPEDSTTQAQLKHEIDRILATLLPKEEQVVRLRFGIGFDDEFTLEEVGKQFGVTRERIRQIEAKALSKLRQPSRLNALSLAARGVRAVVKGLDPPESSRLVSEAALDNVSSDEPAHSAGLAYADIDEANPGRRFQSRANGLQEKRLRMSPPVQQSLRLDEDAERPSCSLVRRNQSGIAKLVALAKTLDVAVDDERDGVSGNIWIRISDTPDKRYHSLVRSLITGGFEYWPGKGYWK